MPQAHEWNTGKVPEDDHEAPLFVEHIPRLWDTLFTFAAFQNQSEQRRDTGTKSLLTTRSNKARSRDT